MTGEMSLLLLQSFWLLLPAGFANMAPVFTNKIGFLTQPIDFNKTFQDKPIFGPNKTIGGMIGAIIASNLIFFAQRNLYQFPRVSNISALNYNACSLLLGTIMGLGAMVGDLFKSFLKRRAGVKSGQSWIPLDQIDWIIGFLFFTSLVYPVKMEVVIASLLIGFLLHILIKAFGFFIGINKYWI